MGYNARKFLERFSDKQLLHSALDRLLWKINATGSADRKYDSGRKRTDRMSENIDVVEELVLSQEDAPGTRRTVRVITRKQVSRDRRYTESFART